MRTRHASKYDEKAVLAVLHPDCRGGALHARPAPQLLGCAHFVPAPGQGAHPNAVDANGLPTHEEPPPPPAHQRPELRSSRAPYRSRAGSPSIRARVP